MKLDLLETQGFEDYELIDSGQGQKLERFGSMRLVRPEEQAIWSRKRPDADWRAAEATFTGDTEEEGRGRWDVAPQIADRWQARRGPITMTLALTSFRHTGVFPEQEAHWSWMETRLAEARGRPRILNLFGYTGIASLVAARAGAEVTHVDASKKAVAWARENQALSGLDDAPIRWIVEDAGRFAAREKRRGRHYNGILLDPPKFGRGPKGERWNLFDDLPEMLRLVRELCAPDAFIVLTAYAVRASALSFHELMREVTGAAVSSGELVLRESGGRALSTSLYSRVERLG